MALNAPIAVNPKPLSGQSIQMPDPMTDQDVSDLWAWAGYYGTPWFDGGAQEAWGNDWPSGDPILLRPGWWVVKRTGAPVAEMPMPPEEYDSRWEVA